MAQGFVYTTTNIKEIKETLLHLGYISEEDIFGEKYYKGSTNFYINKRIKGITQIIFEDMTYWNTKKFHDGMKDLSKEGKKNLVEFVTNLSDFNITDHTGKKFILE